MTHFHLLLSRSFKTITWGLVLLISSFSVSFTQAATILVHGDSLSAGYGIDPDESWVSLLAEQYEGEHKVINSSISGETTQGGLARLPALLEEHQPDIVVLELGANDGLRGFPIPLIEANLQQMIDLNKENGVETIVIGIRLPPNMGTRYTKPFFDNFAAIAEKNDLAYVPFLLEGVAQYRDLMQADGLHPTQQAQPLILKNVLPAINPLL